MVFFLKRTEMFMILTFYSETELAVCSSEAIRLFLVERVELYFIEQTLIATFQIRIAPKSSHFTKMHYSGVCSGKNKFLLSFLSSL